MRGTNSRRPPATRPKALGALFLHRLLCTALPGHRLGSQPDTEEAGVSRWRISPKISGWAAAALVALCACAPPVAPINGFSDSPAVPATLSVPIQLYTHCGIYEARMAGAFFVADKVLDDGHGNPPAGWGNPYQEGTMTVAGGEAVFRDDDGHTVIFHERPAAAGFLRTCS